MTRGVTLSACAFPRPAVAHRTQNIKHELLEELRRLLGHAVENLRRKGGPKLAICRIDLFLGSLILRDLAGGFSPTLLRIGHAALRLSKLRELGELRQDLKVDTSRVLQHHIAPPVREPIHRPPRTLQQATAIQVRRRPPDSIGERLRSSAGQLLRKILIRESELPCELFTHLLDRVVAPILERSEERPHQRLESGTATRAPP
jgi:hypothetical protein